MAVFVAVVEADAEADAEAFRLSRASEAEPVQTRSMRQQQRMIPEKPRFLQFFLARLQKELSAEPSWQ